MGHVTLDLGDFNTSRLQLTLSGGKFKTTKKGKSILKTPNFQRLSSASALYSSLSVHVGQGRHEVILNHEGAPCQKGGFWAGKLPLLQNYSGQKCYTECVEGCSELHNHQLVT